MPAPTTDTSLVLRGIVDDVVSALALALGARRAAALILDEDGANCRAIASCGLTDRERDAVGRWLAIGDEARPYWDHLAAEGGPVYLDGTQATARAPWRGDGPIPPHLATPLVGVDGSLRGVIVLEGPQPPPDHLVLAAKMGRVAATAIEQTRAAEARGHALTRNAELLDIVSEVDSEVELPEVLAAICRKTVEAFGSRQATVYFYSRRHRAALPIADYGTPAHVAARFVGGTWMKGTVPHEAEVQSGATVVMTRDRCTSGDDRSLLDLTELWALVFVPLRDDAGTVRGLLSVGFAEEREFGVDDLRALEIIGRHAAMAIARARFVERTAKSARFRAAVSALAVELSAASGRTQTLQLLCAGGCELFGVDTGALLVQTGDRLVVSASTGAVDVAEAVVALDDASPVARAFQSRDVVLENDRPRRDDAPALDRMRSLLAVPLVGRDGVYGVLVFGTVRPRIFRPEVAEEAPVLGALAAAVLRNADLVAQLHDSNAQLARVSALKDQFLANVSHDLRTPLNVIIGFAQLALEDTFGDPPAELRDILGRMLASARQQLTLVQDLLDVSRLELNGLTVKPAPIPLAPLFDDMEFAVTSLVRQKPVRVVVEAPRAELWVRADPDRLRQILTNLLSNAAKFTDEGTIGLRAVVDGATVRVEVSDSGIGIPPNELDAVFEPFRQVEGERAALGTGLGLAIARRLATLMDGTLTVASTLGRGSTFALTLAAAAPPAQAVDDVPTSGLVAATPLHDDDARGLEPCTLRSADHE
jgi:signal transduction histidine kinase